MGAEEHVQKSDAVPSGALALDGKKPQMYFVTIMLGTAPGRVYIGCPEQVLVLAGSGDHEDYENIFFKKILLVLWKLHS